MKVLVTGAAGQVGAELIERGTTYGLKMLGVDIDDLDITDANAVTEYIDINSPELVINAAAYTAVDQAEEEAELAYAVNCDGPANLALVCATVNIPLLHISTDYIFDGSKGGAYTEEDKPEPKGVYGKSKLDGEQVVAKMLSQHIILRVAWVFAATGNNFVRTMLHLGTERDQLSVVADQQGAPTWAGDIANTLLEITTRYRDKAVIPWGTYHYTGQPVTTWHGFSEAIFAEATALGLLEKMPVVQAITTEQYPTRANRPKNSVLDCHKINSAFNISQPDWRVGLNNVLSKWNEQ